MSGGRKGRGGASVGRVVGGWGNALDVIDLEYVGLGIVVGIELEGRVGWAVGRR